MNHIANRIRLTGSRYYSNPVRYMIYVSRFKIRIGSYEIMIGSRKFLGVTKRIRSSALGP